MTAMTKPRRISVTCRHYPSISRPRQHSARQARRIAANIAKLPMLLRRKGLIERNCKESQRACQLRQPIRPFLPTQRRLLDSHDGFDGIPDRSQAHKRGGPRRCLRRKSPEPGIQFWGSGI